MEIIVAAQNKAKLRAQLFIKGLTTYFLIGTALSLNAKEGSKLNILGSPSSFKSQQQSETRHQGCHLTPRRPLVEN